MISRDALGKEGFVWWFGVVEDVDDPLKCGRVRVRVQGWYSDDVPVSDLPWAQCMESVISAAKEGVGVSPTGIRVGSWVIGFFMDAVEGQRPFVLGTFSGVVDGSPDVSQLARGDNPSNPTEKNSSRTTAVSHPGGSWDEPESAYAAEYPHNAARTTESGHVKEYDDTPGAERIHEYHRSGTFYEIQANGDRVIRIVGDGYEIVAGSKNVNVRGACNLTIDGDSNTRIKGDWNIEVDGDLNETVGGSVNEQYGGSQTTEAGGNIGISGSRIDLNE